MIRAMSDIHGYYDKYQAMLADLCEEIRIFPNSEAR